MHQSMPSSSISLHGNHLGLSIDDSLSESGSLAEDEDEDQGPSQLVDVLLSERDEQQDDSPRFEIEDVPETVVIRCRRLTGVSDDGEYTVCNQHISAKVSPNKYKNGLVQAVKDHIAQVHCAGLFRDELTTCGWLCKVPSERKTRGKKREGLSDIRPCLKRLQLGHIGKHIFRFEHVVMEVKPTEEVTMEKLRCPVCDSVFEKGRKWGDRSTLIRHWKESKRCLEIQKECSTLQEK